MMRPRDHFDCLGEIAISRERSMVVPVDTGEIGEQLRVAGSDLAPEPECRSR